MLSKIAMVMCYDHMKWEAKIKKKNPFNLDDILEKSYSVGTG